MGCRVPCTRGPLAAATPRSCPRPARRRDPRICPAPPVARRPSPAPTSTAHHHFAFRFRSARLASPSLTFQPSLASTRQPLPGSAAPRPAPARARRALRTAARSRPKQRAPAPLLSATTASHCALHLAHSAPAPSVHPRLAPPASRAQHASRDRAARRTRPRRVRATHRPQIRSRSAPRSAIAKNWRPHTRRRYINTETTPNGLWPDTIIQLLLQSHCAKYRPTLCVVCIQNITHRHTQGFNTITQLRETAVGPTLS